MAAIYEHGLVWKDTYHGVWTSMTQVCGVPMTAYAVEFPVDGEAARTDEGSIFLNEYRAEGIDPRDLLPNFNLVGKPHLLVLLPC
jgi:hypothetical protein